MSFNKIDEAFIDTEQKTPIFTVTNKYFAIRTCYVSFGNSITSRDVLIVHIFDPIGYSIIVLSDISK